MIYVYCALIALGINVAFFLAVCGAMVWVLPRYGLQAMQAVLRPPMPPRVPPLAKH